MSDIKTIKRRSLLLGASSGIVSAMAVGRAAPRATAASGLAAEEPGSTRYPRTNSEIAADVMPMGYQYGVEPFDIRRYGARADNATDDLAALTRALLVGAQPVAGAQGGAIAIPTGTSVLSAMVRLPNRVRVLGQNKRGSYFKAMPRHGGPWMFNARNGTSSMFDSTLENVSIDCNNIAGLGCILSDAWQEDCGLRGVLLINFATTGISFQNGYGGASLTRIIDTEIFGGTTPGAIGIDVQKISLVGGFLLDVSDTSITGGSVNLGRGINVVNDTLHCRNVHFEKAETGIYLDGVGNHVLVGVTGQTTVANLVELAAGFRGTLRMIGCYRNGAKAFLKDNRVGSIEHFNALVGGAGYIDGVYKAIPLIGGSGTLATATIVVGGGSVTNIAVDTNPGINYAAGDVLAVPVGSLGGSGSGFAITVGQVFPGLGVISGFDYPDFSTALAPRMQLRAANTAAAWCTFDGHASGTNSPKAGYNVSSVNRTAVGSYTVHLIHGMASAQACAVASCDLANGATHVRVSVVNAASFQVFVYVAGELSDGGEINAVLFGN